MGFLKAVLTKAAPVACVALIPMLLGGCVALQRDLDPIRSDISVMEKQFVEIQRDQSNLKRRVGESGYDTTADTSGTAYQRRISDLEARVDNLEARVIELSRTGSAVSPQPMAPEPVIIEPIGEAPVSAPVSAPIVIAPAEQPVISTPSAPAVNPDRATMAAEDIYQQAMTSYRAGDSLSAERDFAGILEQYPDNRLADNAAFWLGEIRFNRGDYNGAIDQYRIVVKKYPVGDKVPDAVFKTGMAYEELGQKDKARESYNRVMDNYPYSDAARSARQRLESIN